MHFCQNRQYKLISNDDRDKSIHTITLYFLVLEIINTPIQKMHFRDRRTKRSYFKAQPLQLPFRDRHTIN